MILNVHGIVKHKGKILAVGDNGRFETTDERTINLLREMGFQEIPVVAPKEPIPETRKPGRPKTNTKESK